MMKLVRAVLRPERLGILCEALKTNGFSAMTVTAIEGDKQNPLRPQELCSGLMQEVTLPRIQIEMITEPERVDVLLGIIMESCQTGKAGDGRIVVLPVDDAIRIRTGESGRNFRVAADSLQERHRYTCGMRKEEHISTSVPHPVAADQKGARLR